MAIEPWQAMIVHAERSYPDECCGALLGRIHDGKRSVAEAVPLENASARERRQHYELRPEDLLEAEKAARKRGLDVVGIFHSHPDCDAYFSETDLRNSCPWFSFVVLSVKNGKFDHANSFLPDLEQTRADREELICQKS
ncbi:MAG: M67 family metallopeptidase [Acidobacteriaceae bacterium]|nr:M67 family metallopeptidase [Acidobacteriaceae bacterium]MBV9780130.1 M67 family metallopeptidase [Acidobacteriaceae bacterium]